MFQLIYANYAKIDEYESTAQGNLNNLLSMVYVLSGSDPSHYSETEITEETLENGIRLRWQLMRGSALHALWFEAFDEHFGYNMCIECNITTADDAMLAVMRSLSVNPDIERDLFNIRQTKLSDGAFVSVEHGLKIQLTEKWGIVAYREYMQPWTAFMLVLDGGEEIIQLFASHPVTDDAALEMLNWFLQWKGSSDVGEPYTVTIDGLGGVEAWVAEEETGVNMYNVAFVYNGYGYYGMFMWIPQDDAEMRPFMMEALRTLSAPGN